MWIEYRAVLWDFCKAKRVDDTQREKESFVYFVVLFYVVALILIASIHTYYTQNGIAFA